MQLTAQNSSVYRNNAYKHNMELAAQTQAQQSPSIDLLRVLPISGAV